MIIRRTPAAIADVDEIWLHIAADDPDAANRTIERIVNATARLTDFPLSASARPELGIGIRSIPVGTYRVFYRIEGDSVLILRVIHAARDVADLLDVDT